jgi:phosphoenolpyruvate synthase/pyruvate phosphate dikinase
MTEPKYVRWFAEITYGDVPVFGGKNASLGEMYRELTPLGVRQAALRSPPRRFATRSPQILVELGIDSISLTPDSVLRTMRALVDLEKQLGRKARQPEAA